ncbi:PAS domain-containing sensor histidine kinase [Flaviaesturariibacter amylovorans]|uniref:histidine kinase n=2 Tax=Flaviaesturariibacter amylovorans TaxID=1084520 RepID=A0ABP8HSV8_9BACT
MQENYHLLVESIQDYAIYMLDPLGHVLTWNVGAQRSKGYQEAEVIGTHFSRFFTEEDRATGKPGAELRAALEQGRYEEEGWRTRKDGSRFWANVILTPLYSPAREHIGYAKITRDLTEKRRSEELYQLLVSQVKEYALFMLDEGGHILTWNEGAGRIKGYTAPEIIGKHFSIFYTPEDLAAGKPAMELDVAVKAGKYEEEGWRLRKDGSRFWANVVISPIYKDGHIGFAKVTRDLTKRRELDRVTQANRILEASNKELERFAAIASHDLKEPLRKIRMNAERVLGDVQHPLSEQQQVALSKIYGACGRMATLIDDVLQFSTLSQADHFEPYSLQGVLADVEVLLEQTISEKGAVIECTGLPVLLMVPAQMRQLFQNLVSNALKFSRKEERPLLTITQRIVKGADVSESGLWPAEEYLELRFRDNGIGFPQEAAEKIFNLFDRLHNKDAYEGTGLGLAICRKIVENHGGVISARSAPGQGAEFRILLPA